MIFDLNDNPLSSGQISETLGTSQTITIRVECRANYFLRAQTIADFTIEGRKVGDSTWIDLETTGIALTPFAGTKQNFEIRLTGAITGRFVFDLTVSK